MAPAAARMALESLLRERKLDTTLTTALPLEWTGGDACAPTGLPSLDAQLRGGVPRGQVSEIVGPRSSGRTSVLRALMATATRRGELVALIDTLDRFDPASAVAAGVDLARLLWVRGTGRAVDAVGARARLGAIAAAIRPHARQRGRPCARPGHQGGQPRAPVGRVRARGPRHRRRAARCGARAAVQHLDAAAAGRRRERHRVRAGRPMSRAPGAPKA